MYLSLELSPTPWPFTTISRTPNQVFVLSAVAIILIPFTFSKFKSVKLTSRGKSYSSPFTSNHSLPSIVYCTLAFKNVSFKFPLCPNLNVTLSTFLALLKLIPTYVPAVILFGVL